MRSAVLVALAACGGHAPPPPPKPEPPPPPHVTRVPIEDSEQEDGVTFEHKHGHIEQQTIEAGLEPHKAELTDCYLSRVHGRRWLGGRVSIHWDLKADGTISSVKLTESDLGAWEIEKCLVDVARSATFDKPVGGDADFAIPLEFTAKGSAKVMDEDEGLKAVGGQLAKLDDCSKPEPKPPKKTPKKKKDPDEKPPGPPPDNVVVTLYVGPHGKAQSVGFSSDKSEIDERWAECAQKAALAWRLPDPHGMVAKLAIRYRAQ